MAPTSFYAHDAPPWRYLLQNPREMPLAGDDRGPIEHSSVEIDLHVEPAKAVAVGLDLIPMKKAVDHCQINSNATAAQPELLGDDRIRLAGVLGAKPGSKRRPDLRVRWRCGGAAYPESPGT
ncbi:MAG: hypothetical protein U0X73_12630 [Thermoanaerobaculia bacterium]